MTLSLTVQLELGSEMDTFVPFIAWWHTRGTFTLLYAFR